jgi:hypothetical protein
MPGNRDRGSDFGSGVLDADAHLRLNALRRSFERDLRERRLEHELNGREMARHAAVVAEPPPPTSHEPAKPCGDGRRAAHATRS